MPRPAFRTSTDKRAAIRGTPFSRLGESEMKKLVDSARPLTYADGEQLWARGDVGTVACVMDGAFDIVHFGAVVDTVGHGRIIGLSALWGAPHSADVHARATRKGRSPVALVWNVGDPKVLAVLASPGSLMALLQDATRLVHHLNELQVLYRRRGRAIAHVAVHLRRLARCSPNGGIVEIGQKELGDLTGYDERTIRTSIRELVTRKCIEVVRRSTYKVNQSQIGALIDNAKRVCATGPRMQPLISPEEAAE